MADRPELPNQLDVLAERAARHLTPDEARALREQITDLRADLERARRVAVALENENARLEHEQEGLLKATADMIHGIGYARHTLAREVLGWAGAREDMDLRQTVSYAVAEVRSDRARAERAEQQLAQARALHAPEDVYHSALAGIPPTCAACRADWPCPTIAALDGAQQPDTDRQDSHTGACAPPCCAVDPNPAEHPNGAHTDAHDR